MTVRASVVVVGAGTAGIGATRAALRKGCDVILIEGGEGGTTCARVGCMPSKLLIAAAEHAQCARNGDAFGIEAKVKVHPEAVMERVRRERDRFVGFVLRDVEELVKDKGSYVRGQARFIDDLVLDVAGERIEADRVVLAVGSRPIVPPALEPAQDRLIHNDELFSLDRLPESVAVFGPGIIGLELGQALHSLGVRVRIFGHSPNVGSLSDPDLKAEATHLFSLSMPLHTSVKGLEVRRVEGGVEVQWQGEGGRQAEVFDYALVATGRRSNLDLINLEATSLPLTGDGRLPVDPNTLQVENEPVFVAGDAAGIRPILHEAADEGRIAGENAAAFPEVRPGIRRSPLSIVFTSPQMFIAGTAHRDLPEDGFVTGRVSFRNQGRSRVMGLNAGALHVYADKNTGRLLGSEGIGPRLEHIAHLLAWSHQEGLTIDRMLEMPFYHPVIEEGLRTALRDAAAELEKVRE